MRKPAQWGKGVEGLAKQPTQSLYEVCQHLTEGRAARGKTDELAGFVVLLFLAKLAGMKSLQGASDRVQDQQTRVRSERARKWKRMPCRNTYQYALERLDSQKANECLAGWLIRKESESRCGEEPGRLAAQAEQRSVHLALAGKGLKGIGEQPYGGEKPQKHGLHIYEVQTGIVLHHCPILEKQNAVSALKP